MQRDAPVEGAVAGGAGAIIRGTKTGKGKRIPAGEVLIEWIERQVDSNARLQKAPLFVNPRTGRRWSHWALRTRWIRAAESVGIYGDDLNSAVMYVHPETTAEGVVIGECPSGLFGFGTPLDFVTGLPVYNAVAVQRSLDEY